MADFADEGARLEAKAREQSLAALSAANAHRKTQDARAPRRSVECIDCGEQIPPLRLRVIPHALRCTACAQKAERSHV